MSSTLFILVLIFLFIRRELLTVELQKHNNKNQILVEIIDSNLFQLRSPVVSIKNRFNMVYNRATALNNKM